jgi:hypothetical protein
MTPTLLLSLTTGVATMASAGAQAPSATGGFQFLRVGEPGSQMTEMRTCWYDENGTLTGSEPAAGDATVGSKTQVASSGAHTWKYTAAGADEVACPAKLPVSTISRHT